MKRGVWEDGAMRRAALCVVGMLVLGWAMVPEAAAKESREEGPMVTAEEKAI